MASILVSVASSIVETLFTLATDEIVLLMGVRREFELIQRRLERILPVMSDADIHTLQDKVVNKWVKQLRDVVYDVEDIIEECRIEVYYIRSQRLLSSCYSPFACFNSCGFHRHQMVNRIKILNQMLDDIIKDVPVLSLRFTPHDRNPNCTVSHKTSSLVEPDLVGVEIEKDTRMLVDLLLSEQHEIGEKKISVFAIVGMGGIGKTTLAQKIYNDENLGIKFRQRIWVCISRDFSETDLLSVIIRRAGGNPGETKDKEDLELMLNEIVKDRKLLLVLDDVWDAHVWEKLLYKPLQSVSAGSRVLVTTRHEAVVMRMQVVHCHQVDRLSDENGWSLLCKMVFLNDENIEDEQNYLRDIGMRIVKKCDGLPLALKVIAGVLRTRNRRQHDWEEILRNPVWYLTELQEDVMRPLYLSYIELPSYLKRCFAYLALFKEDDDLFRDDITNLWIAEGFVEAKGNILMEDLANEYWKEFVQRSLLQPQSEWYNLQVCKMHDLLHCLAQHLASDECFFSWKMGEINEEPTSYSCRSVKVRRINVRKGETGIQEIIKGHVSLRTLLLQFTEEFTQDFVAKLSRLRILRVSNSSIKKIPNSIGGLVHLRYLDVSNTKIRKIPDSIGNLINLQFLLIRNCRDLHAIPKSIMKLNNLRCLDLLKTDLHSIPAGIGGLQNLVRLEGFSSHMKELGTLSKLKYLSVYKLENTSRRGDASEAALTAKSYLSRLHLQCMTLSSDTKSPTYYTEENIKKIAEIFEELCPPTCLENLTIEGYFGLKYPSWMMVMSSSLLPNLIRLDLINNVHCNRLPPLGLLPQLDCLIINGSSAIIIIGPELFGVDRDGQSTQPTSSFPKLEQLGFREMLNWEEWCWLSGEADQIKKLLPRLNILELTNCPKLRLLPEGLLNRASLLMKLHIEGCHSLTQVKNLIYVERMELKDNHRLESVSNLPALKSLVVIDCEELKHVERVDALECVELRDSRMVSLPGWLLAARERLVIESNNQLLSRCVVGGPDWVKIRDIPCFDAYSTHDESFDYYIHYTKSPFTFDTNLTADCIVDGDIINNKL